MKKLLILVAVLAFTPALAKAQNCDLQATTANFSSQFAATQPGQTLCLAAGNYTTNGVSKSGMVTITAAPGASVTFSKMTFGAASYNNTFQNVSINGIEDGDAKNLHFVGVTFTAPVCLRANTAGVNYNILIDRSTFNNLGQSCDEGRLGIIGDGGTGIVISNSTFDRGVSDGIQFEGNGSGVHIGPGNVFSNILQGNCGAVHCDSIQFYGGRNNVIDGNFFWNDSTIVMSPDCNGTPLTFTNNVVVQEAGSQAAALSIGGANGDIYDHNTFSSQNGSTLRLGNINGCGGNTNVRVTNNIMPNPLALTNGQTSNGLTISNNMNAAGTYVGGQNPTTYAGFALTSTSAGKGAASDGKDIGINIGNSTTSAPAPPTNLQVVVQ